jgi:hypothetical protein
MIFVIGKIDRMNTAYWYVVMRQSLMHIMYSHPSQKSQFKTHNCLNHDFCDWYDRQDEHSVIYVVMR